MTDPVNPADCSFFLLMLQINSENTVCFRAAKQSFNKYLGVFSMREICGLLMQLLRVAELGNLPDWIKMSPEPACSIQI
jgi:hypothetical protein